MQKQETLSTMWVRTGFGTYKIGGGPAYRALCELRTGGHQLFVDRASLSRPAVNEGWQWPRQ